jgi:hypothetical protein
MFLDRLASTINSSESRSTVDHGFLAAALVGAHSSQEEVLEHSI